MRPEILQATKVGVVGVGAIGRQVALQLAQLGIGHLTLMDPQLVEVANLGTQGYRPSQIGTPKVVSTKEDCQRLNPYIDVASWKVDAPYGKAAQSLKVAYESDILPSNPLLWQTVVFLTPDNMKARRETLEAIDLMRPSQQPRLVIDIRMLGDVYHLRTLVLDDEEPYRLSSIENYIQEEIYDDSQSISGNCTTRMTGYAATNSASLGVSMLVKYLRRMPLPSIVEVDLFNLQIEQE